MTDRTAPNRATKAARFIATGLLTNGVLLGLYWVMLKAGLDYRIAVTIGYVIGVTWGYIQNRLWSFKSDADITRSALAYCVTYGLVYLAHISVVSGLVEIVGLGPFVAGIVSALILLIPIFVALDRWVFRSAS